MDSHPPPPPYSETDLYSDSGRSAAAPTAISTTLPSHVDNAFITAHPTSEYAASSTEDSIIYTPPYTPDESCHPNSGFDDLQTQISSSAAAHYFESRPTTKSVIGPVVSHTVTVISGSLPADIPYPQPESVWLAKDVTKQDWATFVNYLIPHHINATNADVADRKVKSELIDERMQRLTLGDGDRRMTDHKEVDALLNPLREAEGEKRENSDVEAVVSVWNEGFFNPRGLKVEFSELEGPEDTTRTMPGSWTDHPSEPARDHPSCNRSSWKDATREYNRRGFGRGGLDFGGFQRASFGRGGFNPGGFVRADNNGFHIGRNFLSADNNGFRLGAIVADNNGFRIGNFLRADNDGFRIGGMRMGSSAAPPPTPPAAPAARSVPSVPSAPHGRSVPSAPPAPHAPYDSSQRGRSLANRIYNPGTHHNHRARSHSTSSTSSTLSSTSTDSIGSLPDYDNLKDGQLFSVKQSLEDWLNHPDQPVTKAKVKALKSELMIVNEASTFRNMSEDEQKSLKADLKNMLRSFKSLKREQRTFRRAERRARRAGRRKERRERRAEKELMKREMRRAVRSAIKGKGREQKVRSRDIHSPLIPDMPEMLRPQLGGMFAPHMMAHGMMHPGVPGIPPVMPGYFNGHAQVNRSAAAITAEADRIEVEANRIQSDAENMEEEAGRMREHAASFGPDDKSILKLIDAASQMDEAAEKLRRESQKMFAEATGLQQELEEGGLGWGQQSGVVHQQSS